MQNIFNSQTFCQKKSNQSEFLPNCPEPLSLHIFIYSDSVTNYTNAV